MPALHLQREIDHLNQMILRLGGQVEENLREGIRCLQDRNPGRGRTLVQGDEVVDTMEVRVEEECLKVLALNQPVATDLRYIIALLKINGELERIGDHAATMGKRAQILSANDLTPFPPQIAVMGALAREMLHDGLDALIQQDINSCRRIIHRDKQVNHLNTEVYDWFREHAGSDPDRLESYLQTWLTAKDLERIADHACSIAEDVFYLVSGEIVRHNGDILEDD